MPRGKRTVFTASCKVSGNRVGTFRFAKQNSKGISWKDQEKKLIKYCKICKKRQPVKLTEERHSS